MPTIPLEDRFADILAKSQRGYKLSDAELAARAGVPADQLAAAKEGAVHEPVLRRLAAALQLGSDALLRSAQKSWAPAPVEVPGLRQFNTAWQDMTVN